MVMRKSAEPNAIRIVDRGFSIAMLHRCHAAAMLAFSHCFSALQQQLKADREAEAAAASKLYLFVSQEVRL